MLNIQIGLVKIPIMTLNFVNNRYSTSGLHQFSDCCKDSVGHKKYCKGCNKDLTTSQIHKGLSKDMILTDEQTDELKDNLENGLMEVLAIIDKPKTFEYDLLPYIQKSQLVLPSISKGFKKIDVRTYYSFASALKDENKVCLVRVVQRAKEHLGVLIDYKNDLLFIELPFKHYKNLEELSRLKEAVLNNIRVEKIKDLNGFKKEALRFIDTFENKIDDLNEVEEEKKILMEKFIEETINPKNKTIKKEVLVNPFS